MTAPVPNSSTPNYDGIYHAGLLSKAYCDDRVKSFYYLVQAVKDLYGPAMVYIIPQ